MIHLDKNRLQITKKFGFGQTAEEVRDYLEKHEFIDIPAFRRFVAIRHVPGVNEWWLLNEDDVSH